MYNVDFNISGIFDWSIRVTGDGDDSRRLNFYLILLC